MSSQRVTVVAAEDRSAHPAIRGVPWWAAILIAVAATVVGYAIDAAGGNGELTAVFATFYVIGCVAAVLAVAHSGIFTAVVQPPLILFVTIPGAYYLMHSAEIAGVKDLVINCLYPLIERFLLMFLTALVVLLIGAARWYLESKKHRGATPGTAVDGDFLTGLVARVRGLLNRDGGDAPSATAERKPRRHTPNREGRPPRRPQRPPGRRATRSRHARPPMDDPDAPMPPPRRRRDPRDFDRAPEAPPRRRAPRDPEYRRESWEPEPWEPLSRPSDYPIRRTERRYGFDDEPPAPRNEPPSHLPFSNVRYRGPDDADDAGYRRPLR